MNDSAKEIIRETVLTILVPMSMVMSGYIGLKLGQRFFGPIEVKEQK